MSTAHSEKHFFYQSIFLVLHYLKFELYNVSKHSVNVRQTLPWRYICIISRSCYLSVSSAMFQSRQQKWHNVTYSFTNITLILLLNVSKTSCK